jgi:hypothetical protein
MNYKELEKQIKVLEMAGGDIFLTGSRAWGVEKGASDYDWVCCQDTAEELKKLLMSKGHTITPNTYFTGWKCTMPGGTVNIVPQPPFNVECWRLATNMLKVVEIFNKEALWEKNSRIALFNMSVGMARLVVDKSKIKMPSSSF